MKIVVCAKFVPDATANRSFSPDGTVDRVGVDGLLSELDEYAVEQALRVSESSGVDCEVVVVTVGPEQARQAVLKSLQMGADAGVQVVDEAVHGSDAVATSLVLAEVVRRQSPDLVVCGMASTDGLMGVVPAMLAERLGWPQVTLASELSVSGTTVSIRRDADTATESVEATLPVVVSVTDQSGEARYPSFKGIMAAKKKPVEQLSLADLDIDPSLVGADAAWTTVSGVQARPPRSAGVVVSDEDGAGAEQLVAFLAAQKFI